MTNPPDARIAEILRQTRTIALVGFSQNPLRPSHGVARYLQRSGYRVVPVNPGLSGQVHLGETVYSDIASIPADIRIDMVDIFRRPDAVPAVVADALRRSGVRTIWMQLGVMHDAAAAEARAAGLTVVQNRCPAIERPRLIG